MLIPRNLSQLLVSSCFAFIFISSTSKKYTKANVGVVLKAPVASIRAHRLILETLEMWLVLVVASHQSNTPCRKSGCLMQ